MFKDINDLVSLLGQLPLFVSYFYYGMKDGIKICVFNLFICFVGISHYKNNMRYETELLLFTISRPYIIIQKYKV